MQSGRASEGEGDGGGAGTAVRSHVLRHLSQCNSTIDTKEAQSPCLPSPPLEMRPDEEPQRRSPPPI